jgi:hypothetical protein
MKKIVLFAISCLVVSSLFAQDSLMTKKKKQPINLSGRPNDHFLLQYGYAGWAGIPDTLTTKGFSKSFNFYLMFDLPFKTSPKLSIGVGVGVGSDAIKFKDTYIGIKEQSPTLAFRNVADTNHFKKIKLVTTYLEAPVEFRYTANPMNSDKSFKFAIGLKTGLLINAHTRYKTLQNKNGATIGDYSLKESSKSFFNTTRLVGTARIGLGHFSLFGNYQITTLFKEGVTADIRPYTIGLTLSGL